MGDFERLEREINEGQEESRELAERAENLHRQSQDLMLHAAQLKDGLRFHSEESRRAEAASEQALRELTQELSEVRRRGDEISRAAAGQTEAVGQEISSTQERIREGEAFRSQVTVEAVRQAIEQDVSALHGHLDNLVRAQGLLWQTRQNLDTMRQGG